MCVQKPKNSQKNLIQSQENDQQKVNLHLKNYLLIKKKKDAEITAIMTENSDDTDFLNVILLNLSELGEDKTVVNETIKPNYIRTLNGSH